MRIITLLTLLAVSLAWSESGYIDQGRCSICKKEKQRSKVFIEHATMVPTVGCVGMPGHYDEAGKWVDAEPCASNPEPWGKCSRGHHIALKKPEAKKTVATKAKMDDGLIGCYAGITGTGTVGTTSLFVSPSLNVDIATLAK